MYSSSLKKLFCLGLAAMILLPAVPLRADGGTEDVFLARESGLYLGEALSALDDDLLGVDLVPSGDQTLSVLDDESSTGEVGKWSFSQGRDSPAPVQIATLSSFVPQEMWQSSQALSAESSGGQNAPAKKGSWLKRKWWVPVVAGLVLGVAFSGGDGDDNADDEED